MSLGTRPWTRTISWLEALQEEEKEHLTQAGEALAVKCYQMAGTGCGIMHTASFSSHHREEKDPCFPARKPSLSAR